MMLITTTMVVVIVVCRDIDAWGFGRSRDYPALLCEAIVFIVI